MEVQHKWNDLEIHQISFLHHLDRVWKLPSAPKYTATTQLELDKQNFNRQIELSDDNNKIRKLPKNGGMEENRSLLPYKNPIPVGPHIWDKLISYFIYLPMRHRLQYIR